MFPLLADQGTGSVPWSPLAGGLLARPWGEQGTTRGRLTPATDSSGTPLFLASDKGTVDAVQRIAEARHVTMAHYTPRKPTYYGSKSGY
jgi:aryl-alcohol dehydrogenase-like predicted oxidoreductase